VQAQNRVCTEIGNPSAAGSILQIEKAGKREINNMPQEDSPYIDHAGTIIIPFNADPKYHYWNGGQPLSQTMIELNTSKDIWGNHTEKPYPENAA
jgi:hypothetical protein